MTTERRQKRLNELIHEEVSELLSRETRDPRLEGVTITRVETTSDLRLARIYFTRLGSDEEQKASLEALNSAHGFVRRHLATRLRLRRVPEVIFHLDHTLERTQKVLDLLQQVEEQSKKG